MSMFKLHHLMGMHRLVNVAIRVIGRIGSVISERIRLALVINISNTLHHSIKLYETILH
jgi:hypothetical protein